MRRRYTKNWFRSKQPRKQRKARANAPLNIRRKLVSAHLDEKLRKEFKRRSIPVRTGDEVKLMRGKFKNVKGIVELVDLKKYKIRVKGVVTKKTDGSEVLLSIDPSNVIITKLYSDDKRRF